MVMNKLTTSSAYILQPNRLSMSPRFASLLISSPLPKQYDLTCVKYITTGGAELEASTEERLKTKFNISFSQGKLNHSKPNMNKPRVF